MPLDQHYIVPSEEAAPKRVQLTRYLDGRFVSDILVVSLFACIPPFTCHVLSDLALSHSRIDLESDLYDQARIIELV